MNPANLRLIRDVAHHRSISKAARLSDLSQSAASQAIQEIERELDVELFDRGTRPLTVTAAGKLYTEFCRDVLRKHDELLASLNIVRKSARESTRLAAIYSVGLSDMAGIESRFAQLFPDAQLEISYRRPERVWEAIEHDEADLGLMSYAESSREILVLPWREEEMVVAMSPDHPLASAGCIRVEQLEGEAFIAFDEDLPIQQDIERFLRERRVGVEVTLRFDNIEIIKQAVAHGSGISIMPRRVMRADLESKRLVALDFDPPELYRPVRIIHRRRKVFNQVTAGLLHLLKDEQLDTRK